VQRRDGLLSFTSICDNDGHSWRYFWAIEEINQLYHSKNSWREDVTPERAAKEDPLGPGQRLISKKPEYFRFSKFWTV
jgi:hypothetical protein